MPAVNQEHRAFWIALETSSLVADVAVGRGKGICETRRLGGIRRHGVELIPTIAALCDAHAIIPAEVERVYVSCGPGSFTGLRIGITVARMLAMTSGAGLVPVPTLAVIAQNALELSSPPKRLAVLLGARRNRVYAEAFVLQDGRYGSLADPAEVAPEAFLREHGDAEAEPMVVMGEGAALHSEVLKACFVEALPKRLGPPRAENVFRLGLWRAQNGLYVDRREFVPTYVRPPEAEEKWQARRGP